MINSIVFTVSLFYRTLLFGACRDLQALFNEEREMISKTMAFSKTVLKTLQSHVNADLLHDLKVRLILKFRI